MTAPERSPLRGFIGGALTGSFEICLTYPIKMLKTQMQLEEKIGKKAKYKGVIDCARQTIRQHGILGLYRGLNILFYGPKAAIRFGSFEVMRSRLMDERGNLTSTNRIIAGLCAGAVEAAICNTPLETIEVKLINDYRSDNPQFRGYFHGVQTIVAREGITGLYQGLWPCIMKQSTNQGIRFYIMESLKQSYQEGDPTIKVPKFFVGAFGVFAGFCSVIGNNPIDVVKTRMQGLDGAKKYKSMLDCFWKIWRYEGFTSFYRGVSVRLCRVCTEVCITFLVYDAVLDIIRVKRPWEEH